MAGIMTREAAAKEDPRARPGVKPGLDPKAKPALDPKAKTDAKPGEAPPQKRRGRGRPYVLLGLLALATAGAAWKLTMGDARAPAGATDSPEALAEETEKPEKSEPGKPPQFMALETLTVNLRDEGGEGHYLQVGLTYQVAGPEVAEAMKVHMPVIRSNILLLLSSKAPKQIMSVEGKTKLSEELLVAARQPLPGEEGAPKGITAVFYSSFIIQ